MKLANCTREIEFFCRMLQLKIEQRILLIEAPSGYGKSDLLFHFSKICPPEWKSVVIDLKTAELGIAAFISKLQLKLGDDCFPIYEREAQKLVSSTAEVTGNKIVGDGNQIQIILNDSDESRRKTQLGELNKALVKDLANIQEPILLLLDTFNSAPEDLQNWLLNSFLGAVMPKIPKMLIVLAGQDFKGFEPFSIEWRGYQHKFLLKPILDVDAWCKYANRQGYWFCLDKVIIWTVANGQEGIPEKIVQMFQVLEKAQK